MAETEYQDPFDDPFADLDDDPFADLDDEHVRNPLAQFPSPFPDEPGTSRASQELGEMFVPGALGGDAPLVGPGRTVEESGGGVGSTIPTGQQAMVSAAALTMTDPQEIADMLSQFPEIGITYAPDGAIIATNNETGARGLINRPGASGMDALQMLGLGAAFTPAGKVAGLGVKTAIPAVSSATMRKQMEKAAVKKATLQGAAAAGVTQTGIEGGHELTGGEFDPEDIAFSTLAGGAAERLAKPIANIATKGKELIGKAADVVPKNVMQALEYAKATGRKIYTSDALSEFMTPIQQIFMKTIERVPITGIGRQKIRQKAARADALIDLANKYNIDIQTELGQDIADNFITRMIKQRFWGKNAEVMDPKNWPTGVSGAESAQARRNAKAKAQEMLERAFEREADDVVDFALAKQLRQGNLDDDIVERVLDQAKPKRVQDLFNKLMPEGKLAVKQRFLTKGLERAGWTPDAPQIADPDQFVKYLTNPKNKKMLDVFFDEGERDLIEGTREYLRITAAASKTGQGAGMVAAVGGGAAVGLALVNGLWGIAMMTAIAGRGIQSAPVRNLLLKLTYAKGNPAKSQVIMQALRPAVIALENQYFESGGPPELPDVEFNKDMMKDLGDYSMEYLRTLGDKAMDQIEDVSGRLSEMLTE